jgi:hypothetical protein
MMDYDKLIEQLHIAGTGNSGNIFDVAALAIETLRADLARVTAERDAAVESIPHDCKTCAYHVVFFNGCTPDHDCTNPDGGCSNNYDRWRWRGIKKEG